MPGLEVACEAIWGSRRLHPSEQHSWNASTRGSQTDSKDGHHPSPKVYGS